MSKPARRSLVIEPAPPEKLDAIRTLFLEYSQWIGVDLAFQGFAEELASLPGKYAPPDGTILAARFATDGGAASAAYSGCVALRRFDATRCEMKRLWVRPDARGHGLGGALVRSVIEAARERGYHMMVLDTLRTLEPAMRLYRSFGFHDIAPYYHNPLPNAVYLSLELQDHRRQSGA